MPRKEINLLRFTCYNFSISIAVVRQLDLYVLESYIWGRNCGSVGLAGTPLAFLWTGDNVPNVFKSLSLMQRELLGPSAIIFETLHGPWILGAGRGLGSHSSIFPPQQKSSLEYPWLSFSLCLNIPVTEFTVFPGNPFHIWLFILWLVLSECWWEEMI